MKKYILIFCFCFINHIVQGQCLGSQSYTLTPAGPYTPGQTVTVTYTLSNFIQVNINWIIAFDIDLGAGWTNVSPVSAPGNPGGSNGAWIWDNQNTYPSGLNFGPGYRFQNYGNGNWGTGSTGPFTLSFQVTVDPANPCTPQDLSISMSVIGDCQTGGWNNGACCNIIPYSIYNGTSATGNGSMAVSSTINEVSCNGFSDGSIDLNISGGNSPFLINWSNGNTSQNITGLSAGTYSVVVTDNIGCVTNESYTLIEPPAFTPTINSTNISCFGDDNGVIEVINEPSSTSYLWSNLATTSTITNLSPGSYSVDVTDINNCVFSESFNIIEPAELNVIASSSDISCNGFSDGSINFTISGGITDYSVNMPPYSQVLSNGATTYSQSSLNAGAYNYSIVDSNGCTFSDFIIIDEPTQLTTNPIITNVLCTGDANGTIILNTSGGTFPYIETFGGNNPLMLDSGFYSYTVTDNNGCTLNDTFSISQPDSLLASVTTTNASCNGYSDGTATLLITGGFTPYNINWNGNNPNALSAGNYTYLITDDNGCINQGQATIYEPPGMEMTIDTFRVTCFGGNDGSAVLNIIGGAGGTYNINWGGLNPNALYAGDHIITVIDSNNCSITDTVIITQPSDITIIPLTNHVSCNGNADGNTTLQISGGIYPYSETWFGINPSSLAPGTYPYLIIDANNCTKDGSITIYEPDILAATATISDVDCYGENDGSADLNITGGTAPYDVDFGTYNQYALPAGSFNFTITDMNGCIFDSLVTIEEGNEIFLDFIATSPICRYDESTLSIKISNAISNPYTVVIQDSILKTFEIDTNGLLIPEGIPIVLSPNFSGKVIITSLTDENGCSREFNDDVHIEVKQLPELTLNIDDICVGEPSFTLNQATPVGGSYFINNEINNFFDVENLETGGYSIRYEYTDPITSCYNEIQKIITISESPEAGIIFSPQPADMNDPNIFFKDNSNDIVSSICYLGDGTIIYDENSFWHTYDDAGTYTIQYYITNEYNCTDSIIEDIIINPLYNVYIPTAFSPNNDDENDYFYPSVTGAKDYNIKIYNRWGEIVYNEDNDQWDGKVNGKRIKNTTYSYSITIIDFKDKPFLYTGLVSIIE